MSTEPLEELGYYLEDTAPILSGHLLRRIDQQFSQTGVQSVRDESGGRAASPAARCPRDTEACDWQCRRLISVQLQKCIFVTRQRKSCWGASCFYTSVVLRGNKERIKATQREGDYYSSLKL